MLKKIWLLFAVITLVFALGACNLGGDPDPDDDNDIVNGDDPNGQDPTDPSEAELLAQAFISNWSGDLTYLSNMIDSMMGADSFEITTELYIKTHDYWYGEQVTRLTSTDKYVYLADSLLLQRQMVMEVEGMEVETNIILVESGNGVTVYFDAPAFFDTMDPEIYDELSEMFAIDADWIRLDLDDSLANLLEFEILNQFIQARLLEAFLGDIASLDEVEEMLLEILGIDEEAANLRLQVLFETLFEFDLNLVVAHLLDIDAALVAEGFLDNVVGMLLLDDFYYDEEYLRGMGFDFDTYVPILEDEGFRAALVALTSLQAEILGDYLNLPVLAIQQAFNEEDVLHALIMLFLEEAEYDLRELEGFDYDLVYDVFSSLDLEALHADIAVYDFNAHFESLALGYYLEYYEDLPESELKTFFGLLNDLVIPNMGEAAIVFEFNTLLEDLVRFDPYLDLNYFGNHAEAELTMDMTEDFQILTAMHMSPAMLEAFATEFFGDVWHWLNQLQALDFPEVDPISCEAGPCEDWYEFIDFFAALDTTLVMSMLHDPADLSAVTMHLDLTELLLNLTGDDELVAFELSVSIREGAQITVPTASFHLNELFEDLAKLYIASDIYSFLYDIQGFYDLEPGVYPLTEFFSAEHYEGVFDLDLSTVEVTQDGNLLATFYYLDGSPVFETVYDLEAVRALTEQMFNRESFLGIIAIFDAETFHITRLLVLLLSDFDWNIGGDDPFSYWFGYYPPHLWWWDDVEWVAWEEQIWYLYVYDRQCPACADIRWTMLDFWMYSGEMLYFIDLDDVMGIPTVPLSMVPALYIMQGDQVIDIIYGSWDIEDYVWPLIDYGHGQGDYWFGYYIPQLTWWEDVEFFAPVDETWYLYVYMENEPDSDWLRWSIIDLYTETDSVVYVIDIDNTWDAPTLPLDAIPTLYVMFGDEVIEILDDAYDIYDFIDALVWD
ncbi:MAG: hypothetical protein EA374_07090 [Acholeplasmatales bacterium]|nr:MAG: hypothetical protein EA374_07090 [Acholeplasmatales bacterium]